MFRTHRRSPIKGLLLIGLGFLAALAVTGGAAGSIASAVLFVPLLILKMLFFFFLISMVFKLMAPRFTPFRFAGHGMRAPSGDDIHWRYRGRPMPGPAAPRPASSWASTSAPSWASSPERTEWEESLRAARAEVDDLDAPYRSPEETLDTARSRQSLTPTSGPGKTEGVTTVLVVDDEPRITGLVRDYLNQAGFGVLEAANGERALELFHAHQPGAVVLDLGLPGIDGLDVVRRLRRVSDVPIVILTARSDETDRVVGLELGADDYVVKPFGPKELVARIRAVLRRTQTVDDSEVFGSAGVVVDTAKMRVSVDGAEVELTPTEFQILATLVRRPGRVFTRSQLLDAVHGVSFESYERAIDAHIKNIRRKVEPAPSTPRLVLTVHGVGYRFTDDRVSGDGTSGDGASGDGTSEDSAGAAGDA